MGDGRAEAGGPEAVFAAIAALMTSTQLDQGSVLRLRYLCHDGEPGGKFKADPAAQAEALRFVPALTLLGAHGLVSDAREAAYRALGNIAYQNGGTGTVVGTSGVLTHIATLLAAEPRAPQHELREAIRVVNNTCFMPGVLDVLLGTRILALLAAELSNLADDNTEVVKMCVGVVYNLAMNSPKGREYFRGLKIEDVLAPIIVAHDPRHRFVRAALTAAAIYGGDEKHHLFAKATAMVHHVCDALKASVENQPYPKGSNTLNVGQHIVLGMEKLAGNEENKKILGQAGAIDLLHKSLAKQDWGLVGSDMLAIRENALAALWKLSFYEPNRQYFDADLVSRIRGFAKGGATQALRKNARGVLWQLDEAERQVPAAAPSAALPTSARHAMISYSWEWQETVKGVKGRLLEAVPSLSFWMDVEQMEGSTLEAMALAVENAGVVCVFLCRAYKDSPNCRTEAEYAFQLGRRIIPILVEPGYRADGWLGALVGAKLWYDVSSQQALDDCWPGLVKALAPGLAPSAHIPATVAALPAPAPSDARRPQAAATGPGAELCAHLAPWGVGDVHAWLSNREPAVARRLKAARVDGPALTALIWMTQTGEVGAFLEALRSQKVPLGDALRLLNTLRTMTAPADLDPPSLT